MLKIDPRMQAEIFKKIDQLSANLTNSDYKTSVKNFFTVFVSKIQDEKSIVHIDTFIESISQYIITMDIDRRFTTLLFIFNFLTELSKVPKPNFHRFLDKIEFEITPKLLNIYSSCIEAVSNGLKQENKKYKYNVGIMSMILVEKILIICSIKFSFNKEKKIRTFETCIEKLPACEKMNDPRYSSMNFDLFEDNLNFLEAGPRVSDSVLSNKPSPSKQEYSKNDSGNLQNGSKKKLISALQRIQQTREKMISYLNASPTEEDVSNFDQALEVYKNECFEFSKKIEVFKSDSYDQYKKEIVKEIDFLKFLLEDLPKIFSETTQGFGVTIQEIKKSHDKIFGHQVSTQSGFSINTNKDFPDFNKIQDMSEGFKFNDFDKIEDYMHISKDNLDQELKSDNRFPIKNFNTENPLDIDQTPKISQSPIENPFGIKTSKNNLFNDSGEFGPNNSYEFPAIGDAKNQDRFSKKKKIDPQNDKKKPNNNFNELFGIKNDFFDRPIQTASPSNTIKKIDDVYEKPPFESKNKNLSPIFEPISDLQSHSKLPTNLAVNRNKQNLNFNSAFGETEGNSHISVIQNNHSMSHSQANKNSFAAFVISTKEHSSKRYSNLQEKKTTSQIVFSANQSHFQDHARFGFRDSHMTGDKDTLHQALNKVSQIISSPTLIKSKNKTLSQIREVNPPTIKFQPKPTPLKNIRATEINFSVQPMQVNSEINKKPAPFTAVYEEGPNVKNLNLDPMLSRMQPQKVTSNRPNKSNIIINQFPKQSDTLPSDNKIENSSKEINNDPGLDLDDFTSVKSNQNPLVESIIDTQSNAIPQTRNSIQLAIPKELKLPDQQRNVIKQSSNPLQLNIAPNVIIHKNLGLGYKNRGENQLSDSNQIPELPPQPRNIDKKSIQSANEPKLNFQFSADNESQTRNVLDRIPPQTDYKSSQHEDHFREYKHTISQYELILTNYKQEIKELQESNAKVREDKQNFRDTISLLKTENINLNELITSLKIKLESEQSKHENNLMKQKELFKKNNDGKIVAMERSYNENLQKVKVELNEKIMELQAEINNLTIDKNTLILEKEHLFNDKEIKLAELKEELHHIRKLAGDIRVDLETKGKSIITLLQTKQLSKRNSNLSSNEVYNELLIERRKNTELTKQIYSLSNEANLNPLWKTHQRNEIQNTRVGSKIDPKILKNKITEFRTNHQKFSLLIMESISQLSLSLVSIIKGKSSQVKSKILSLENSNKQKDFELAKLKFEIVEKENELGSSKQNFQKTIDELQSLKKEVVENRMLNQTGNAKTEVETDLARRCNLLELENKKIMEYNNKVHDELLQAQEKLMSKASDYISAKTHYAIVRNIEAERDELMQLNQSYLNELKVRAKLTAKERKLDPKTESNQKARRELDNEYDPQYILTYNNSKDSIKGNENILMTHSNADIPEKEWAEQEQHKLCRGMALINKASNLIQHRDHYIQTPLNKGSLLDILLSQSTEDHHTLSRNCSKSKYAVIRNSDISIGIVEKVTFVKHVPRIEIIVRFRNFNDLSVTFSKIFLECTSNSIIIETHNNNSQPDQQNSHVTISLKKNEKRSVVFTLRFNSNFFSDIKPIYLLFQSSCSRDLANTTRIAYSQTHLNDYHRIILPITINKLLETKLESAEKLSVIKMLNCISEINVRVGGPITLENLTMLFSKIVTLDSDEEIYALKILSPQGIFFVVFAPKEHDSLNVKIFGMFELKVYDALLETIEFILKNALYS